MMFKFHNCESEYILKFLVFDLFSVNDCAMLFHEFTGKSICKPVSFEIKQGDRIVLDGKNGAGKSSLLKMLVGEHVEQSGTVSIGSGLVVSYVQQDTSDLEGSLSKFAETNNIEESLFKAILRKLDFP